MTWDVAVMLPVAVDVVLLLFAWSMRFWFDFLAVLLLDLTSH